MTARLGFVPGWSHCHSHNESLFHQDQILKSFLLIIKTFILQVTLWGLDKLSWKSELRFFKSKDLLCLIMQIDSKREAKNSR